MKKSVSLFLVFSIIALSMPLTSQEKKGADLIIQRTDRAQVRGELIAVKENSLVLLERNSGADVTIKIEDIYIITSVKKWRAGKEFFIGAMVGILRIVGGIFILSAIVSQQFDLEAKLDEQSLKRYLRYVVTTGAIGTLISGLLSFDKNIQLEGKSEKEIQEILEKLRKKARIRNAQ